MYVPMSANAKITLDTPAHSVTFSPDGNVIAVGLGLFASGDDDVIIIMEGQVLHQDGGFVLLETSSFKIMHQGRDSKR